MNNNLIYGLRDPRNDVYRYIGKTTIGYRRPLRHLLKSHNESVNEWIKGLNELGMIPYVDILERNIPLGDLAERENYYIKYYSDAHGLLFNKENKIYYSISKVSLANVSEIKIAQKVLLSLVDVVKLIKIKYGIRYTNIAYMMNISRLTIGHIVCNRENTVLKTVLKLLFFAQVGLLDIFNFYIDKELNPKFDTYDKFVKEFRSNKNFINYWCNYYYRENTK